MVRARGQLELQMGRFSMSVREVENWLYGRSEDGGNVWNGQSK